ncbi:hypothetical protein [Gluconobacter oxydans]|uniref:hypothetical protein n=1 Tax=Gluconobacter oxydans TaxID=442 RepID=UPI001CD84235|nr:hypothetical protein [Gluconobacter oxydans]
MRFPLDLVLCLSLTAAVLVSTSRAHAGPGDEQAYSGSLFSPPTPLPKAGAFYVEPYLYVGSPIGQFGSQGDYHPLPGVQRSVSSLVILKYGITNRISVYITPQVQYSWQRSATPSGLKFTDLPFVLQGVALDRQSRLWPGSWQHTTLTMDIGMNFPTGSYDRLSRAQDGSGSGVYSFRYGLIDQTGFKFGSMRPFRVRLWATGTQPVTSVPLSGQSVYGTSTGFSGRAHAEAFGNFGGSVEFSLNDHFVFALDMIRDWSSGSHVQGRQILQTAPAAQNLSFNTPAEDDWFAAPAIEYNWNASTSILGGVGLTLSGRDTTRQVIGTLAFEHTF